MTESSSPAGVGSDPTARPVVPVGVWLGLAAAVVMLAEGVPGGNWIWLGGGAVLLLALAVTVGRLGGIRLAVLAVAIASVAVAAGIAAWRTTSVGSNQEGAALLARGAAIEARDRMLAGAVAGARQTARNALARVADAAPGRAASLDDLLSGSAIEQGLVVLGGDTVVAMAGPQRVAPITAGTEAALLTSPFVRVLIVSASRGERTAQVALLLDGSPALPGSGGALADRAGNWQRIEWQWAEADPIIEYPSAESAIHDVGLRMAPNGPGSVDLLERERWLARVLIFWTLAILGLVVIATGAPPAVRAAALLLPAWILVRPGIDPAVTAGMAGFSIGQALLVSAAVFLFAVTLWRRHSRRSTVGLVAAVTLLAAAPVLIWLARNAVRSPAESTGMLGWFIWQAVLATGAVAYLAVASAPLRQSDDSSRSHRWGAVAALLAVVVAGVGIEAWSPGGKFAGWAVWYLPLWLLPLAAMLPRTTDASRRVAVATTAGALAALVAWSASLESRMSLAQADLDRLGSQSDAVAIAALEQFGDSVTADSTTSLEGLYALWRESALSAEGVPTQLAIWTDSTVLSWVALDTLWASWGDLEEQVEIDGSGRRRSGLARGPGRHEVLVLPISGDTAVTVLIGPRSLLVRPTRFGRLVGWRSPIEPPYRIVAIGSGDDPPDRVFRRNGRFVRAEHLVTAGEQPTRVRAEIEMSPPQPFVVRAALTLLLDVLLALVLWRGFDMALGAGVQGGRVFRRSYRRTLATTLTAFFVVPAALFTLWSMLRLRQEVSRERGEEVTRALMAAESDPGFSDELMLDPDPVALAQVADRVDAEVAVYHRGRLAGSSTPLLAQLGLIGPVIDPALAFGRAGVGRTPRSSLPGAAVRLAVQPTGLPATVVAAALPAADARAEREQVDLALLLLLASLGGTLAAVAVAGTVADALGQPIEALRARARAIGRRQEMPPLRDHPAEFEPVFAAITQMERDLLESEAHLEDEAARTARIVAWGEMARQVAHEIKNPLTPMRLGLQHLLRLKRDDRDEFPEQLESTVAKLLSEIDRLDTIARSFARYGSPPERQSAPLESIDLAAVVRELAEFHGLTTARPRVVVITDGAVRVEARREELIQVLLNLLDNARIADAGEVRLEVTPGLLRVVDDGTGIAADQLERIFEPTFSTTTSGTGLGLAIVRRLVEGWGATIDVSSRAGEGTEFEVRFG